jgi:hypothetical protein
MNQDACQPGRRFYNRIMLRRDFSRIPARKFFFPLLIVFSSPWLWAQAATAQPAQQDLTRSIDLPLEQWLQQGERTEMPWKVRLSRPLLTYQLREVVRVIAEMPSDLLQKQALGHDVHFIVKAAPEHGAWDPEESYSRLHVDARLDPHSELKMLPDFYLRPGIYTIAAIAYDATSGKHNVAFSRVQVDRSDRDPFPQSLDALPAIQFLPPPDNTGPVGRGHVALPVATERPVHLDLIVDLSTHETALLQIANLLSGISFEQGCVHVTAVDIPRRGIIVPLADADKVDWEEVRDQILSPDRVMVSVADLESRHDSARFVEQQLDQIRSQPSPCEAGSQDALHVVAIVSPGLRFPSGTDKSMLRAGCDCKVFYLEQTNPEGFAPPDLRHMLKPLAPVTLKFSTPQDLRRTLVQFMQALERLR